MSERHLSDPADLAGLMERVVVPVVRAMVHDHESVDGLSLAWEGDPPSRGQSDLRLSITVEDETFWWIALTRGAAAEDDEAARTRLASDFQDFIAESRFGWGESRPHPF